MYKILKYGKARKWPIANALPRRLELTNKQSTRIDCDISVCCDADDRQDYIELGAHDGEREDGSGEETFECRSGGLEIQFPWI